MHRFAALMLSCALVAGAVVVGAPAPLPRPSDVWFTGWDEPEEGTGKCRFDRTGDRLTMTLSGRTGRPSGCWLSRVVEGDFVAQIRVRGNFRPSSGNGSRHAGLTPLSDLTD